MILILVEWRNFSNSDFFKSALRYLFVLGCKGSTTVYSSDSFIRAEKMDLSLSGWSVLVSRCTVARMYGLLVNPSLLRMRVFVSAIVE